MSRLLFFLMQAPQSGGNFQLIFIFLILPLTIYLYILFIRWLFKIKDQINLKKQEVKLLSLIAEKLGVERSEIDEILK